MVCERGVVGVLEGLHEGRARGGQEGDLRERGEREYEGVVLERNVLVEAGAVVEARRVGEGTVVEVGAKVGRGCVLGKVCYVMLCSSKMDCILLFH